MGDLRFEQRMSDSDALMWTIEKDPMLRSTITSVLLLDSAPDHQRLADLVERGTRLVPRMRQRVRSNPLSIAPPRWEVDPNFDLHFHLRFVRAGGDRSLRALLDLAEPIAMQGFDRARPLWEMTVVEGLVDEKAALIMKVHHAITDGVGAVKIALVMFELEREAVTPGMPEAPEVQVLSQRERFLDALRHEQRRNVGIAKRSASTVTGAAASALTAPGETTKRVADTASSVARMLTPATSPLSPLMTGRSLSVHFDAVTVPLNDAKAAAKAAGGKLNDAFLAATAAGFRRYHDALGRPAESLRMSMPISIRTDDTSDVAGNQFAPARFPIPLTVADPLESMRTMHDLVINQRAEPALAMVEPLARLLNRMPTSMSTGIFGSMLKGIDVVTSNVPGAPIALFIAGSQIEGMFAFGPMTGAGANLTLLSYLDELLIGISVDPAAVSDPVRFVQCYRDGWDEILKAGA